MTEGARVPKLRFKGFNEPWEEQKMLKNVNYLIDHRGKTPKKLGLQWSEGGIPALSAMNVKNGYIDFTQDAHFGNADLYAKWMKGNELHKGQVILTTEAPMGNIAQIPDDRKYILSQRVIAFVLSLDKLKESFFAVLLRSQLVQNQLQSLSSGGTAKGVSQRSLSNIEIAVPKRVEEQETIGKFFTTLDEHIVKNSQLVDKLKQLKQAMLEKMFPREGETVPELRFPGFIDPWASQSFESIFDYSVPTNTLSRAQLKTGVQGVRNIHYGDILIKYGPVLNVQKADMPIISDTNILQYERQMLRNGDIVIADAAEDSSVGKAVEISHADGYEIVAGLHTIVCRPMQEFSPHYLGQYLNSKSFRTQLTHMMQGTKVLSISKSNLSKSLLLFPTSLKEQEAIGQFFTALDDRIAKMSRRVDKLKQFKQALLEKMFV